MGTVTKRIVLHETQGPHRGLWHIAGTSDDLANPEEYPAFVEAFPIGARQATASLITVKPRYVLYREVCPPSVANRQTFHPEQR